MFASKSLIFKANFKDLLVKMNLDFRHYHSIHSRQPQIDKCQRANMAHIVTH